MAVPLKHASIKANIVDAFVYAGTELFVEAASLYILGQNHTNMAVRLGELGTSPVIMRNFSPIDREIVTSQKNLLKSLNAQDDALIDFHRYLNYTLTNIKTFSP